jgi:hypothetical protein
MAPQGAREAYDEGRQDSAEAYTLLLRARTALEALSEGKVRTASGLDAVKDLRERLSRLSGSLQVLGSGIDLREVQESIVEHAAMYANCPEVLGGMLQLVFCLDHIRCWLEERDAVVKSALAELDKHNDNFEAHHGLIDRMGAEVRACTTRAKTLELECTNRHVEKRSAAIMSIPTSARSSSLMSFRSQQSPRHRPGSVQADKLISVDLHATEADKVFSVDLQALENVDRYVDDSKARLEELERENAELRGKLAEAFEEAAASRSAAEAARSAAEETAAAATQAAASLQGAQLSLPVAASAVVGEQAARSPLDVLEQLEPMLAGLPVGKVPGMSELQEEACDAYGRLRSLLMTAAAGTPAAEFGDIPEPEPFLPPMLTMAPAIGPPHPLSQQPLYTWRSSTGTSEEPEPWHQATLLSDPVRGVGAQNSWADRGGSSVAATSPMELVAHPSRGVASASAPVFPAAPLAGAYAHTSPYWTQEHHGVQLRANRLS